MVKDIYAKKPESANPTTTTGGAVAPFTLTKAPIGSSKRVHFQEGETLSDRIDKLTETLYRMDMEGKPTKKPYKPYITSPRHRGGARFFLLFCLCKLLETGFLVPALFGSRLHLLSEGCALVWGMFVRGCAR